MSKVETGDRFWMVWNPNRGMPRCRHASAESATLEAERLAGVHVGEDFYVLEAIQAKKATALVHTTELIDYASMPPVHQDLEPCPAPFSVGAVGGA